MKIKLDSNIGDFNYISDNSLEARENPREILLLKTKLNEKYFDNLDSNIKVIEVRDLGKYLQNTPKIIGITGTNGKTTIASCIYSILLSLGKKVALLGTRGFFINGRRLAPKGLTTPTLLELYYNLHLASLQECDYFVMEVSSHAIAQERIEGLDFTLKVISNIQSDHLDFHKTHSEYKRVKNSFLSDEGLKLINRDCTECKFNAKNAYTYALERNANLKVNAYSLKDSINAHISWRGNIDIKDSSVDLVLDSNDKDSDKEIHIKLMENALLSSNLVGKYNLYNVLASVGAVKLVEHRIPLDRICEALGEFGGVEGRLEVVNTNPLVIVDFAHTPDGMENVFEAFTGQKIVVVFGAGGDRDKTKRPKMGQVASNYARRIYLTSDNPRSENPEAIIEDILGGIKNKSRVVVESNRKVALNRALSELENDEVLLVLGKGDETYQIIGDEKIEFDDRVEVRKFYQK